MTEFVMVPRDLVAFLLGEGAWRGINFGEDGVVDGRGRNLRYWWRTDLRQCLAASPQPVVGDREAALRMALVHLLDAVRQHHNEATCDGVSSTAISEAEASLASQPEGDQELSALQAASQPSVPGGDGDGAGVSGHTPECWGRTSYFDEMTHCYCAKPSEADTLAVLLDNLVIAQSLSRELRDQALDQARSYLYDRRQRLAAQPDTSPPGTKAEGRSEPILPPPSGEGGA